MKKVKAIIDKEVQKLLTTIAEDILSESLQEEYEVEWCGSKSVVVYADVYGIIGDVKVIDEDCNEVCLPNLTRLIEDAFLGFDAYKEAEYVQSEYEFTSSLQYGSIL